ncbi:MAG: hypothetical protein Q9170_000165 [Blastenia crenularia]
MSKILHSPNESSRSLWISLLEPYLPLPLRRKGFGRIDRVAADTLNEIPVRDLHIWLAEARKVKEPRGDLLTYLAVEEERQDAVVWLVEEMLKEHTKPLQANQTLSRRLPRTPHDQLPISLDDFTRSANDTQNVINATAFAGSNLNLLTERTRRSAAHECLGEIWHSIGSIILQAADRDPTSAKSKTIMKCVHRLLAHLHHVGSIPSSIYNYTLTKDPSVLQRPPTIHYWSLRIMTVISDTSCNSMNPSMSRDGRTLLNLPSPELSDGGTLPLADMSSMMPEVGPQIWLDFVLWCCVEGGWVTEAAEIMYEMWARKGEKVEYSVIDYDTLREQHAPKLSWTTRIKATIRGSRMRETVGGATFGTYSDRLDFLNPPERTVSSEVVAAIIDGLVNTASPYPDIFGNKHSVVEKYISVCKFMLDRKQLGLGSISWDSVILRIYECLSISSMVAPTFLEPVISWSPPLLQEPFATNSAYHYDSTAQKYVADPSALSLGLLHRLLSDFALRDDFRGTLRVFRRLQDIVDLNQRISLGNFKAMVTPLLQEDGEDALVGNSEQQEAPGLNLQLPPHILAPFLDLITDSKEFALGNWLLYSDDVDGCIIPPGMYTNAVLQPSLIRFASATGDQKLLDSVTECLEAPIPVGVLRALLHHQIQIANWDAVREIFELLSDGDGLEWDPTDVMALARAMLKAEKRTPGAVSNKPVALPPAAILIALLRGQYNKAHNPSRPRDLTQTRMLNQLARIIASVPSQRYQDLLPFCNREYNQLSASCDVSSKAFNMLLESVVEIFGPLQGKHMCELWCFLHGAASLSGAEQVVQPDIQTFYTILRPLLQVKTDADADKERSHPRTHQASNQRDGQSNMEQEFGDASIPHSRLLVSDGKQSVIDWGIARCLDLGARWKDIKQDLPGLAFGQTSGPAHTTHSVNTNFPTEAGSTEKKRIDLGRASIL